MTPGRDQGEIVVLGRGRAGTDVLQDLRTQTLCATAALGNGNLVALLLGCKRDARAERATAACRKPARGFPLPGRQGRARQGKAGRGRRRQRSTRQGQVPAQIGGVGVACTSGAWPARRGEPSGGRVPSRPAPSARPTITPQAVRSPPPSRVPIGRGGGAGRGVTCGQGL